MLQWAAFILVAFTGPLLYFCYRFFYVPFQVLQKVGIRGPRPLPFFGHYRDISRLGWMKFDDYLHKGYGDVVGFYLGQAACLLVTDLDMVKQITVKDFDSFVNRVIPLQIMKEPYSFIKGLLFATDDHWRAGRQTLSPSFTASKMRMMVPAIKKSTDTLVERLGEMAATNRSCNVQKIFGSFTMETILAIAFGRQVNLQKGEADELTLAAQGVFRNAEKGTFPAARFILSNFPFLVRLLRWKVSNDLERMKPLIILYETALGLVKARREETHSTTAKYKDLLQLMIDATGEEEEERGGREGEDGCPVGHSLGQKGNVLTNEEIVAHAITFILAGYETTSNTLAYTSYLLALHPDVQESLRREIDIYFDEKPGATLYEASQEITYLDNVIQESLRLYPPAARTMRVCSKTTEVCGTVIPHGTMVHFPIHVIHREPKYWENPEEFNPHRFTAEERAKRPQLSHLPFGFGPRNCIGMRFALLEAKIAMIELLKRYSFVRAPDTEVPLETALGITLSAKNGIFLKVESH